MRHLKTFNEDIDKSTNYNELLSKPTLSAVEFAQQFKDPDYDDFWYDCMKEFAKMHVANALKAAHDNMQVDDEDLGFTMDSYPMSRIV